MTADVSTRDRAVRPRPAWWTSARAVFVLVLVIYVFSPVDTTAYDPALAPLAAHSLVHERDLDLDEFAGERLLHHPVVIGRDAGGDDRVHDDLGSLQEAAGGAGTHTWDYFPWTSAVAGIPAVVAAEVTAALVGPAEGDYLSTVWFRRYHVAAASVLVALAAALLHATALLVLTGDERRRRHLALVTTLAFALGTSAWSTASRALWQHAPSLLCVAAAVHVAVRLDRLPYEPGGRSARRAAAVLGTAAAGAAVVRPVNMVVAATLGLWLVGTRPRLVPPAVAGALGVGATFVAVDVWQMQTPVPSYYAGSRVGLHDRFLEAMAANWLSPSRGLLWASPVVLLALPGVAQAWRDPARRPLVAALVGAVVGVTVGVSAFEHWWAGHSFGPRFMTEALVPLAVLALPAVDALARSGWRRAPSAGVVAATVLVVASVAVHAVGAGARSAWCWNVHPTDIDADPGRVWSLSDSQPVRPVDLAAQGEVVAALRGDC